MAYDVYFDKVLLPIAPSKITTSIKNRNKSIELINEGEVNILKDAGLTEISFQLLLPNQKYPFAKYNGGFKNASYYLSIIEEYKINKKPFQLIISRVLPNGTVLFYTNLKVCVENYDIEDDASEGFDTIVSINLKQYKTYGTKIVKIEAGTNKKTEPTKEKRQDGAKANNAGKKYTIKTGDTLWGIAKSKLGSGTKWKEIYNANKSVIKEAAKKHGKASDNNGQWIYAGTVIVIPNTSS